VEYTDAINRTRIEIVKIIGICKTESIHFPGVISEISKNRISCKIYGSIYKSGIGGYKIKCSKHYKIYAISGFQDLPISLRIVQIGKICFLILYFIFLHF